MAHTDQIPSKEEYEERSRAFALVRDNLLLEAREHFAKKALEAAQKVTGAMELGGMHPDLAPIVRIELDAAKETLKASGVYVDKVEHSGRVTFEPLRISRGDDEA